MENQCGRHECGPSEDSCECFCHPGARSCPGCEPMHGSYKTGRMMEGGRSGMSMNPAQVLVPLWYKAFFTAQSELMVEKIKKRIDAAYGPTMDKLAEAFMESMGKQWQAMLQKTSANQEFQEKLTKILGEASQQQKQK
jgi:hypothetical protein